MCATYARYERAHIVCRSVACQFNSDFLTLKTGALDKTSSTYWIILPHRSTPLSYISLMRENT